MPPRYSRRRLSTWWWLIVVALLIISRAGWEWQREAPPDVLTEGRYRVARVVDGDTLRLESGTRVRLQGIDAPETVKPDHPVEPWGPEAADYTRQFIADANHEVRLTFGKERLDQYGRLLAFVWHGERLLNEELVREGLARARLGYRYAGTMKTRLAAAEKDARAARRGLWSPSED